MSIASAASVALMAEIRKNSVIFTSVIVCLICPQTNMLQVLLSQDRSFTTYIESMQGKQLPSKISQQYLLTLDRVAQKEWLK